MALLLRRLHKNLWAQYAAAPEWAVGDCPPKILEDLVEKDGISTWLIVAGWDVKRTVSAIAVGEKSIRDFVYALIDEQQVRAIGIEIKQTPALTIDSEVSKTHRDLMKVSAHKIVKLASLMMHQAHGAVSKDEILTTAHLYFKNGVFDKHAFALSQRKLNGEIVEAFLRKGLLDFV